jgi:hypothetical protein
VNDLLHYYLTHPTAVDTSEGLARWRLLEEYVERTMRETQEALDWLVAHGFLREITRPGGRTVFMMNADRRPDAERFLAAAREGSPHGER